MAVGVMAPLPAGMVDWFGEAVRPAEMGSVGEEGIDGVAVGWLEVAVVDWVARWRTGSGAIIRLVGRPLLRTISLIDVS
jgi:hypothetical protein